MSLRIMFYGIAVVVIFATSAFLGKAWYDWFLDGSIEMPHEYEEYPCPVSPAIQVKEQKIHEQLDSVKLVRLNVSPL